MEEQLRDLSTKLQRAQLKNQALTERVSALTAQYEDQDAERRVDITLLSQEKEELTNELSRVRQELEIAIQHTQEAGNGVQEEADTTATD